MAECVDSQKTIDILICPICLERFTKPKSLPCLHTFCEGCILTYSTSILDKLEGKNHINCPVCRATVQLPKKECTPKEFVDQLPANSLVIGLLEKEKFTRLEKICMSCERLDITSNATFICMDCSDTLCDTCQKYHKSNKATSNHDIKPISTLTDEEKIPKAFKNISDLHSKKLKLFCNDHDVPCCTLCVSLGHRKCDNVVTIEEKAKSFFTDAKFEKLKWIYDMYQMILIFSYLTTQNVYKAMKHNKQTLEVSIEKASEVQVMIEAQKIASQIEKYKQLLRNYKFDGSKILICFGTGVPNDIDVFMNSLFKISLDIFGTQKKISKSKEGGCWSCPVCLISNESDVQKCAACQTLKPGLKTRDIKQTESKSSNIFGLTSGGAKFGNTNSDKKSSGISFQSGAKPTSATDIKFGQTTKADSTTPDTGSGFKFGGQTVSTVKPSSDEGDTVKPPPSGAFKFGQLPESDKDKATSGAVSFGQTVSFTSDKITEPSKSYQSTTEPRKCTLTGFTFKQTAKPGFSFCGEPNCYRNKQKTGSFKPSPPLGSSTVIPKPEPAKKDEKKGFGNRFKPKEGSWKCIGCLMSNNGDALKCLACGTLKPGVSKEEAKASGQPEKKEGKKGFGDLFKPKEGAWKCDGCLVSNSNDVLKCPACGTLKPGVKKKDIPNETEKSSAFGSSTGGFNFAGKEGFTFGTAGKYDTKAGSGFTFLTPDSTKEKSESKPSSAGFTFKPTKSDAEKSKPGSAAKGFNFTFQPSATREKSSGGFSFTLSPSKDAGPKSPPTDAEGLYLNKDGDDDYIHFEPIIELPSVVDVFTGEEDEEVLFQHRAKLFRFVDGEWKELGDIKISKHKESGKVRLLMLRAQIHKICLNHYLTQELELKPMQKTDGKAWIWFAMDFSDDEPAMQQLAVKFKNHEIATGFKKAFDNIKVKLESSVTTQISTVSSVEDSDDRNDGIEFVREDQATKEQITMARKFLLPDHFYLYEKKPSCPGCIGCEDYEPENYF
ncbi:RANBP2 [Mytilus coruscus]|uniref:Nuclear pore complex protein Nup153 n=1 Tax=Mytilus coruscus TaxID=42192 RepID=A0A6J8DAQ0_MYTCO|nr:RANBP2 [Mytilus coruscus]